MTEFIEVHWTSGSIDEARKISRYLVQEKLVACSQIIPWIESVYLWNGQIETSQESKIVLKTRRDFYDRIKQLIIGNCSYEVPEITFSHIDGGNEEYLDWMRSSMLGEVVET